MLTKKSTILILLITLIFITNFTSGFSKNKIFSKKRFGVLLFNSNLIGIGIGCNYSFTRIFSMEIFTGTKSPATIIWAEPYEGSLFNLNIRANASHRSGIYVSSGIYAGIFNIFSESASMNLNSYVWKSGPTFSIGFKWPNNPKSKKIGIEFGTVLNLPTKISVKQNLPFGSALLETDRSEASKGAYFPFLTFLIEL